MTERTPEHKHVPPPPPAHMRRNISYYRSVFLSDFHIGAKNFDARALEHFLSSFKCDYLYLAGDIIDGWKLNKRWYWTEDCSRVLGMLIRKIDEGTHIIYLPGNHDEQVRHLPRTKRRKFERRTGVLIRDRIIHTLADGRRFLVLHGDQFDHKILRAPAVSKISDMVYDFFIELFGLHTKPPQVSVKGKMKPFSLAKALGKHGAWALQLLGSFESAVYKSVHKNGLDGLICGHTHIPIIKPIRDITYANCGSWLRGGHTALTEDQDGKLELIDWPGSPPDEASLFTNPNKVSPPDCLNARALTHSIVNTIRKIWPEKGQMPATEPHTWIEIESRDRIIHRIRKRRKNGILLGQTLPQGVQGIRKTVDRPIKELVKPA